MELRLVLFVNTDLWLVGFNLCNVIRDVVCHDVTVRLCNVIKEVLWHCVMSYDSRGASWAKKWSTAVPGPSMFMSLDNPNITMFYFSSFDPPVHTKFFSSMLLQFLAEPPPRAYDVFVWRHGITASLSSETSCDLMPF